MSKKCPECGSLNIESLFEGDDSWCNDCGLHFPTSDALIASVFDHITESVEKLAEVSVCKLDSGVYYSHITGGFYATENKAIAATIEELKKEWKSGKDNDVPANPTDNNVGSMEV
jgi:hypothetical protein